MTLTSDGAFDHLLDYLRIGAGHCQVNPRPKERLCSNCAPTPAKYLSILRFGSFLSDPSPIIAKNSSKKATKITDINAVSF